jgi:hypothetical protein
LVTSFFAAGKTGESGKETFSMGAYIFWFIASIVVVFLTRLYNELRNIGTGRRVSDIPMIIAGVVVVLLTFVFAPQAVLVAVVGAVGMGLTARFV